MSIKVDKSLFTASELAQYEQLIAKAMVDPEAAEEEFEEERVEVKKPRKRPEVEFEEEYDEDVETEKCNTRKSFSPLDAAMARLENLEKSIEMKEFSEIAKKYAALGEDEEDLANTLYSLKKSDEANYDAYINVLDKSLNLIEKTGIFAEIGKSAYGGAGASDTVSKIETIASEIMKSDPGTSREMAVAKAWEAHPELIAEYDAEYKSR